MEFSVNANGTKYFRKQKINLLKFLFTAPFFIIIITLLFIMGAKSTSHLYVSIFLLLVLTFIIILTILSIFKKINSTVNEIVINENYIILRTFKVFFIESKDYKVESNQLKLYSQEFQIGKNEVEKGWKTSINKHDLYLFKSFFDEDIIKFMVDSSRS